MVACVKGCGRSNHSHWAHNHATHNQYGGESKLEGVDAAAMGSVVVFPEVLQFRQRATTTWTLPVWHPITVPRTVVTTCTLRGHHKVKGREGWGHNPLHLTLA